jgi:hypothetical protein
MLVAYVLRRSEQVHWWPVYVLLAGVPCWIGLIQTGVHPALTLVFVVPFLPSTVPLPRAGTPQTLSQRSGGAGTPQSAPRPAGHASSPTVGASSPALPAVSEEASREQPAMDTPERRASGHSGSGRAGSGWVGSGMAGSGWAGAGWASSAWAGSGWAGSGWAGSVEGGSQLSQMAHGPPSALESFEARTAPAEPPRA